MNSTVELVLGVVAGLTLFLAGVTFLSEALRRVASERIQRWLHKATVNRVVAVVTGVAATTVLDSSSAVIIIAVGLVDAGLLKLAQAIGIALGANIGTTVGSQIIALQLTAYAPVPLAVGFLIRALGRNEKLKRWGQVIFSLGMVFFGLEHIGQVTEPLRDAPWLRSLMERLSNPVLGALAGAAVTAIIQSSSATVGIVITLAGRGLIPIEAGVALMLGAEIGTTVDALIASIGRSRETLRLGLFQVGFNVAAVALGLLALRPLTWAATALSSEAPQQIANAHVLFNVGSVLLALPFTTLAARLLERLVPDRPQPAAA